MENVYCYFIILVILTLVLICIHRRKKESYDSFQPDRIPRTESPQKPHGIDTNLFPKFPMEMKSDLHHDIAKVRLSKIQNCSKCEELEKKLVQHGQKAIAKIEKNRFSKPNLLSQYKSYADCEMCGTLLQTWGRYFTILQNMSDFIYDKKLPPEPKISSSCHGCNDIQNKDREYARDLKKELECYISGSKYCQHAKFKGSYNHNKDCKECENTYNTWQMYIFTLKDLVNYYRFGKNSNYV